MREKFEKKKLEQLSKNSVLDPSVSGAFRMDERLAQEKSAEEIAKEAAKKGRFKKSLHQRYDTPLTPEIVEETKRRLGERDD